jgi:ribosomal protein S18 acetylase RimI-like enzyme
MQIRNAQPSDRDLIISLDHIASLDSKRIDFLDHAIAQMTCLVTESAGHILGYGVLDYSFFANGFIPLIYVSKADRRKGVGLALLNALVARCGTQKLFTSTNESNTAMRSLLVRAGFIASGVIYNLDPEDPEYFYFKSIQQAT